MSKNTAWKNLERKIAKLRGSERTPLSGGSSKHTRSDIIDDTFFVEIKLRANPSVWNLYERTEKLAKKEQKVPVVVIKKGGKTGELFVISDKYFDKFMERWKK